jgi:hypothetical protein
MKKLAVNHRKAHMPACRRPGAPAAAAGRGRHGSSRLPRAAVASAVAAAACPARRRAVGLAFAAVRPAFVAACIVEPAGAVAAGQPAAAGAAGAGAAARRCWRLRPGGARATVRGVPRRGQRNGQMEHFSQVRARLRRDVERRGAITPRERTDALDLRLTTWGDEPCVLSSIFGFVMT